MNLCLLTNPIAQLRKRAYPQAWKQFCENLKGQGIEVVNCPIDTRDTETNQFVHQGLAVSPDVVWWRSDQQLVGEYMSLNTQSFVQVCRDKWMTYQTLLPYHPITYLGSEYFSLGSNKDYILKPRYGQRKQGVQIMKGKQIMQREEFLTDQWIIQDYRRTYTQGKSHHDIRCIMTGDQIVGSIIRWGHDLTTSRQQEVIELSHDIQLRVQKRAKKVLLATKTPHALWSLDIGIEATSGRPFVIECNSAVGIPSILSVDPGGEKVGAYIKNIVVVSR